MSARSFLLKTSLSVLFFFLLPCLDGAAVDQDLERSLELSPEPSLPPLVTPTPDACKICNSTGNASRLNFESCCSSSDCAGGRKCYYGLSTKNEECKSDRDFCVCKNDVETCKSNSDCDSGETCSKLKSFRVKKEQVCIGKGADLISGKSSCSSFCKSDTKPGKGVNQDSCCSDSQCSGNRECKYLISRPDRACEPRLDSSCKCVRSLEGKCQNDGNCDPGEICWKPVGSYPLYCVSERVVKAYCKHKPENCEQESPEETCVDARILREQGLQGVYASDKWSWTNCDLSGSCATDGHMVVWNGVAMSMKRYCASEDVVCERKLLRVNSPKGWGVRMGSRTNGLKFTSLAARWNTNIEEHVLRRIIHMGA